MIRPFVPFAIRGALWYQGESNGFEGTAYAGKMRGLIEGWRREWGQGDFPFYLVQLANFGKIEPKADASEKDWTKLREAQLQALSLTNTGVAVTIDIGDSADIHPKNKQDVGKRLARLALAGPYDKDIEPSGPVYKSSRLEGGKMRVVFDHAKSGLMIGKKEGRAPVEPDASAKLKWIEIAGEDRVFKPADAVIEGGGLVVSSREVAAPVAVRYAFIQDPVGANLYNKEGLPAAPFRTDSW
jgi:sialate O-acetylesterase